MVEDKAKAQVRQNEEDAEYKAEVAAKKAVADNEKKIKAAEVKKIS